MTTCITQRMSGTAVDPAAAFSECKNDNYHIVSLSVYYPILIKNIIGHRRCDQVAFNEVIPEIRHVDLAVQKVCVLVRRITSEDHLECSYSGQLCRVPKFFVIMPQINCKK